MTMNFWKIFKIVILSLLVILTAGLLWVAIVNGQRSAQARHVVKDVNAISQALEYFYQDQNRYPAIGEFEEQNVMREYLSNFPPQQFVSGPCTESITYQNSFRNDYELRFCLPKGVKGYQTGWNSIKSPAK